MLNAVLALNDLDTKVFDSPIPGEAPRIYDDHVTVPDAHLLFNGQFQRVGSNDLKIVGEDGQSFFIQDYFASETRTHLMSPQGATLSASVVEALAGPLAPGQHAQAGGQPASTQPVIGRVDALSGSATVVRNGVTVSLNVGDTVRKGDVVQTSGSSSVAIVFTDGSTFSLNANARMVLDEFVYAAGGTGNSALISLVQGTFSFVAGQVAKTGDMKVETPVATMGIRGTAVLVEISANDGQTRFSVMVEPDGTTGAFNLYNKTTGALIGTVSNSQVGWVVTPAGPLQVVAQQVQKTPGELAQELGIVQQIFTIFNNNQQNPFVPTQDRGDNPNDTNPQTAQGGGGSGSVLTVNVPITTPDNPTPINVTVTVTPVGNTNTDTTPELPTPAVGSPPQTPNVPIIPTLNIINGSGTITGTPGNDQITGSQGDDVVDALAGNDFVFAGDGDDIIVAASGGGNDFYDGGTHIHGDTIKFESANGVVFDLNNGTFNLGGENIVKSSTASSLGTGTDVFVRVEKIIGSAGNDVFILNDAADWEIDAGAGIDIVRLANGVDFFDDNTGPEISNWEIADLATDTELNIVYFDVGDFDNFGDEGSALDRAPLRVLGGENDVINITNHEGIEGYWVSAGTFVDPAQDGTESDPFNDHFTDGVTFIIYQFVSGEEVIGTVYVEDGVQITLPNVAPDAEDDVLENIPLDWTLGPNNHFYKYVPASEIGWQNAADAALAAGGYLATITSDVENDFVSSLVGNDFAWLGGSDAANEGQWVWTTEPGSSIAFTFTNWASGEPNDRGDGGYSAQGEDYLATWGNGTWNDLDNSESDLSNIDGYVIEREIGTNYRQITEDSLVNIATTLLLANDSDVDDDTLVIQSVGPLSQLGAAVTLADGQIIYDASRSSDLQALAAGETATDTFSYTIGDGNGGFSTATVTVTVNGTNDAPVAVSDSAFVQAGGSVEIDVLANDGDVDGDVPAITGVGVAEHGTVFITEGGKVVYTPNEGYSGTDSFTYTIEDPDQAGATGYVSIVVGSANHQQVEGDVFLQGNYMEIGVSSSGSLGTAEPAPQGYHPQGFPGISYVVDIDGWDTGAPPTAGDFTLPGSPVDTIVIGHDGRSFANDERTGWRQIDTSTLDTSASGILRATTTGSTISGLDFTQIIELDPSATYYKTTILLQNATQLTMDDVRFMRSFDPDQDVANYGDFDTRNDVLANPEEGSDLALTQAFGPRSGISVNLVAFDDSARASNYPFSISYRDAYGAEAFDSPYDAGGAYVDGAIMLTFSAGDLAAGESARFEFFTSLNGNQGANDMLIGTGSDDEDLNGRGGDDIIIALGGNDTITGGTGNDRFIFSPGSGEDTITDFTAGIGTDDVIELRGFNISFEALIATATDDDGDTILHLTEVDNIRLDDVSVGLLHRDDFSLV